jgi:hypothetical protein
MFLHNFECVVHVNYDELPGRSSISLKLESCSFAGYAREDVGMLGSRDHDFAFCLEKEMRD